MENSLELQTLVSRAKVGDRESFRVLYSMLSPRVFRFIRPRARSREDALDVLQETFVDFWKGLPNFSYQGDTALDAFLYRIASRKLSRVFRLWRGDIRLDGFDDLVIEETVDRRDRSVMMDIVSALSKLPAPDREILTLRHIEGRSFSDIARLLGKNENTLKVRHHRAIGRLRQKLHYD